MFYFVWGKQPEIHLMCALFNPKNRIGVHVSQSASLMSLHRNPSCSTSVRFHFKLWVSPWVLFYPNLPPGSPAGWLKKLFIFPLEHRGRNSHASSINNRSLFIKENHRWSLWMTYQPVPGCCCPFTSFTTSASMTVSLYCDGQTTVDTWTNKTRS